jgi:hypothetical protein
MGVREFKFFYGFTIDSEGIQGIVRTLRSQWRPELVQDLNAVYSIDATDELTRLMSEQIAEEIDNEIIRELTRTINDGGQIRTSNVNADYLQRYLNMGGNTA